MSYLSQAQDPKRRAAALTGTIAVNAAIAVALVTGLTITGYTQQRTYTPIFEFRDPPPPPPPQPQEQQQQKPANTVITVPPAPHDLHTDDTVVDAVVTDQVIDEVVYKPQPDPIVRPDPPSRPIFTPRNAKPANNPQRWVTTDDYQADWLRRELEGTAGFRVVVGTNGRVSSCEIVRTSGTGPLDSATCRYITQRARFDPATDETGAKVVGVYTGSVRWEIPD
jgi:protein TonB